MRDSATYLWHIICIIILCWQNTSLAQKRFYHELGSPLLGPVNCMAIDENQVVWAGTEQGLLRIEGTKKELFTPSNSSLRDGHINRLVIDRSGNKWLGTYQYGLLKLDAKGQFSHYPFDGGFFRLITDIALDKTGTPWVSTQKNGIFKLEEDGVLKPKYQMKGSKLPSNTVYAISFLPDGTLLAGTDLGLCEIFGKKININESVGIIQSLLRLGNEAYACALTLKGPEFWKYNSDKWTSSTAMCQPLPRLQNIIWGKQGIWLSTDEGLLYFDGKACTQFDRRHGLLTTALTCAAVQNNGRVWVGTATGQILSLREKEAEVEKEKKAPTEKSLSEGGSVTLKKLNFQQGTAELLDSLEATQELSSIVREWEEESSVIIEITGHTDNRGSAIENWKLSRARARAVAGLLEELGAPPHKLLPKWEGESQPIAPNDTEESRKKNRRVVIRFLSTE